MYSNDYELQINLSNNNFIFIILSFMFNNNGNVSKSPVRDCYPIHKIYVLCIYGT